jgi:outer membrane protein assembly factor BamB
MISPTSPTIINGTVFALSTGRTSSAQHSFPAVLYALDGATGRELWNSGKAITSPVGAQAVSGGGGQVYVTARDGTLYAFGFPMEH